MGRNLSDEEFSELVKSGDIDGIKASANYQDIPWDHRQALELFENPGNFLMVFSLYRSGDTRGFNRGYAKGHTDATNGLKERLLKNFE